MPLHRAWYAVALAALALTFALCPAPAHPVPPPLTKAPPSAFVCKWAGGKITLDGKADEAAWKGAAVIDTFYLPWLGAKARLARTGTKARLLWDREYLYFFAEMQDADLYAEGTEGDSFALFLKPAADRPGYYELQVNPAGFVQAAFLPRRGAGGTRRFAKDADSHAEVKVRLDGTLNKWTDTDRGWSVEGRIPWTDLLRAGGRPEPGEKWNFALCRRDCSVDFEGPELSTCAPLKGGPDFHRHEEYATLTFAGPDSKSGETVGIDRRIPLTTSKVAGWPDPPPPYRPRRVYPGVKPDYPIFVAHQPGSDRLLFIAQRQSYGVTGLYRFKDDPAAREVETLLEMDGVAYSLAFHPDFARNGHVFIGWNGLSSAKDKKTKVTRYTMARTPPYKLDPKSEKLIIEWPSDGHNGAALCFGKDGMLYVTSGDGTSDSDTNVAGQRLDLLLSKVLRIDPDHADPGKTYSVPKDNPFVGVKGVRPETWAYGLRNPWRMTADPVSGQIWVGNNGQDLWEQAYLLQKGANYGWSVYEGSHPFYLNRKLGPDPLTKPTIEHHHSEFRSLTGGLVYRGKKFPDLVGAYIYGDYSTGKVWGMKHDGKKVLWHKELATTPRLQITGFGTDARGEILICDHRGQEKGGFYTLEPTPAGTPSTFPKTLSESGLFRSVKGHVMQPGVVPYSVNAPFWSDGAHKERWLALPGKDSHIDFTRWRGWNFPDGAVLIKSFALELEQGNPSSRHWVETRFLTKQEGEWYGYSYSWNDEQTEATLVEARGLDREFTIKVPPGKDKEKGEGVRKQVWHYPGRAECMVCHSRAANFVLGLCELQMNREHDYGGRRANQLRTLEHLGMLRLDWAAEVKGEMRESCKARGMSEKEIDAFMERQTATRMQRGARLSALLSFPPEKYRRLTDPYDRRQPLDARARSFLHANCSACHVEAGGGNAQMELEFTTPAERMRVIDVKPLHHTFGLSEARLVAPGHPERSVLLRRVATREQGFMPPLATSVVDEQAVEMLREWIAEMKPE